MVGSMFTRLLLGSWIDRYGSRPLWIGSLLLLSATCIAHLTVSTHAGPFIYLLRISYCCALAGVNGASMTFVSGRGPTQRIAELVGMLGTAGFLGTVVGTLLGDIMLGPIAGSQAEIVEMFLVAAILGLLAIPLAWAATAHEKNELSVPRVACPPVFPALLDKPAVVPTSDHCRSRTAEPSLLSIVRRHNPGVVLAVGVAMGIGLGLPSTFLRPYAAELGIPRIGLFFLVYAVAAIITRVVTRRWAELYGPRRIILLGLAGVAVSMMLFLLVQAEWQLVLPAIGYGCSHAILFPAVVAAGSLAFPPANRGLATLLMLATWDLGQLIGAPAAGVALRVARLTGLPPYPTMFLSIAVLLGIILIYYAIRSRVAEKAVDFSAVSGSNKIELGGPAKLGQGALAPSAAGGQD
jgi:MFS family permease